MRYLYTFLIYLMLPFLFLRLILKSLRQPAYRLRLMERLGFFPVQFETSIWVHAVSMGEAIAAIPLIKSLQKRYPHLPLVVTTMTPTGAERLKLAFSHSVTHLYLPYDFPFAMKRLLNKINPQVCIIIETELWPNLLAACRKKRIPVCLVNARLSEKSASGYRKMAGLTKEMLSSLNLIASHGKKDAERFIALGASCERLVITGNIKFDIELPANLKNKYLELRKNLGENRFIWIAASTHEGEEEIILAAHKKIREYNSQALLILVPRHPNRFDSIAKLSEQTFKIARRSLSQSVKADTAVYLGDTLGELLCLYGASDVALVAGSLIPRGGHNMLEPGALSKPIITGEHLFNFAEISELFVAENALIKVKDANSLAETLLMFIEHPEKIRQMGESASRVIANNRGALEKQVSLVNKVIDQFA